MDTQNEAASRKNEKSNLRRAVGRVDEGAAAGVAVGVGAVAVAAGKLEAGWSRTHLQLAAAPWPPPGERRLPAVSKSTKKVRQHPLFNGKK